MGVVLYDMLAGKPPFDSGSDTPVSVLYKHVYDAPPPLTKVSPRIQALVNRALSKDPKDRHQSAAELARALSKAINEGKKLPVNTVGTSPKNGQIPSTPFRVVVVNIQTGTWSQSRITDLKLITRVAFGSVILLGAALILGS